MKKKKYKVPMVEELFIISDKIKDNLNGLDINNVEVVFTIDKQLINKINEDYYYRNNKEPNNFLQDVDEVNVIVNDILFKYKYQD